MELVGANVCWRSRNVLLRKCGINTRAVASVRNLVTFVTVQAKFGITSSVDVLVGRRSAVKGTTEIQRHAVARAIRIGVPNSMIVLR